MFILYRTTNQVNGKFYIGVHNSSKSWYKGSGSHLKRAIKKYGIKNFYRETLFEFESEAEAYLKEEEIVNLDLLSNPLCYNLKLGGKGGRTGIVTVKDLLTNELIGAVSNTHPKYISGEWVHLLKGRDTFKKAREASIMVRKGKPSLLRNQPRSRDTKLKISNTLSGRVQSQETKNKRSQSMKGMIQPKFTCPHCGKVGSGNAMKRWHFDACS